MDFIMLEARKAAAAAKKEKAEKTRLDRVAAVVACRLLEY